MRLSVSDLLGHPGRTRAVEVAVTRAEAGTSGDSWGPADDAVLDPLVLDLVLESMVDGIFVHGTIGLTLGVPCARCLEPIAGAEEVTVAELLHDPRRVDPDDEEVEEGYLLDVAAEVADLETLIRDHVVPAVPVRLVHDDPDDCGDLWAEAGVGGGPGATVDDLPDPRWSALADLRLPSDEPSAN